MKFRYFVLTILALVVFSGCLKENYAVQYSFTPTPTTETKVTPITGGVDIEFPFADFSCDTNSLKAVLGRTGSTYILTIQGNETEERCSQKFTAQIIGIEPGDYTLQLVYRSPQGDQQVLFNQFTVSQ